MGVFDTAPPLAGTMNEIDPSKKDELGDSSYSSYSDYKGHSGNIIDPKYGDVENADLQSMYVKPSANKVASIQRRANMEAIEKQRLSGCQMWLIAIGVVIGLFVAGLHFTRNVILDSHGDEQDVTNLQWVMHFFTRTERVAMLENFDPEYRRYFVTVERLQHINAVAEGQRTSGERILRPEQMVDRGLINAAWERDGWGTPIEIIVEGGTLRIISGGQDRFTRNADDIYIENGTLKKPVYFMNMELEREAPGAR